MEIDSENDKKAEPAEEVFEAPKIISKNEDKKTPHSNGSIKINTDTNGNCYW